MTIHDEEVLGKAYDARLMRRLLTYLKPYRVSVVIALFAIIGHSVLQLAPDAPQRRDKNAAGAFASSIAP